MNRQAFEAMLSSIDKDIYSFCCKLTLSRDDADDLFQDTIVKAYELHNEIDEHNNPKSFIISISIGLWKNHIKKERRRQKHISAHISLDNDSFNIIDTSVNIENDCIKKEEQILLLDQIKRLDYKYKVVIILYYYNHYSQKEISKICNLPLGTVKSRLHKAKNILKKNYIQNKTSN